MSVIHVHVVCRNEVDLIPWIIAHYARFATRIFFHDNFSDDGTRELILQYPIAELLNYDSGGEIRDDLLMDLKNTCWKDRGADWVLCVDADEFVVIPGREVRDTLASFEQTSCAIPQTHWYEMIGEGIPVYHSGEQLYDFVTRGVRCPNSKCLLFRAASTLEINYDPGAHLCRPQLAPGWRGPVSSKPEVFILHFKYARPLETVSARHRLNAMRLSALNRARGWGFHYESPHYAIETHARLCREATAIECLSNIVAHLNDA